MSCAGLKSNGPTRHISDNYLFDAPQFGFIASLTSPWCTRTTRGSFILAPNWCTHATSGLIYTVQITANVASTSLDPHPTRTRPALDSHSTRTRPAFFPQRPTNSRVTRIHSSSLYPLDGSFTGHARTLHVVHTIIQGRAVNGNKYCRVIQCHLGLSVMCEKALETVRPTRGRAVTSQSSSKFICGLNRYIFNI